MPLPRFILDKFRIVCVLTAIAVVSACAAPTPGAQFNDPYENTNRAIHAFNKGLDRTILRPAGQVVAVVPHEFTDRVVNFSDNVGLPGMIANGLLQADIGGSATNTMRFIVNTTVGIGGLFDPASAIGLFEESTDFGETLAVWGVGEGPYVELPVFGPSTGRAAVGRLVDLFLDPLDSVGTEDQIDFEIGAEVGKIVIVRGRFMDAFDSVLYGSADSYAAARLLYLQNRRFELGEEPPEGSLIDPFSSDLSIEGFE